MCSYLFWKIVIKDTLGSDKKKLLKLYLKINEGPFLNFENFKIYYLKFAGLNNIYFFVC